MGVVLSKKYLSFLALGWMCLSLAGPLYASGAERIAKAGIDARTGEFVVAHSADGGMTWTKPFAITKNGSAVKAYKISTSELPPSIAWIERSGGLSKVFYTTAAPGYTVSEIIALPEIDAIDLTGIMSSSPFIVFSGQNLLYMTNSVDAGKNWSSVRTFSLDHPAASLRCAPSAGLISVMTDYGSLEPISIPAPAAPGFIYGDDIFVSSREIEQSFSPSPGAEKNTVAYLFEMSADKEFRNPVFSTIEGETIRFSMPRDFAYGTYYCRIAAWNGLEQTFSEIKTLHFTADNTAPEIKLVKPASSDWIRNGSVAAFEFSAADPQGDIKDETEAAVYLNGATLEASLIYDKASGSINGIASIPANTPNGTNILMAEIRDIWGNKGSTEAKIAVDSAAPVLGLVLRNNTAYSNSRDRVLIPLKDEGAGPDLHNSSVKLFYQGITVEGTQAFDAPSGSLVFTPKTALQKDVYTVEIISRDLAGNRGEKVTFSLAIDQTAPKISMDPATSETTAPMIVISGTVDEKDITGVSVQKNLSPAKTIPLSKGRFYAKIELDRGNNRFAVTAVDLAGNSSTAATAVHFSAPPDTVFFKFGDKTVSDGDFISSTASPKITDDTNAGIPGGTVKIDGTAVPYNETTGAVSAGSFTSGSHTMVLTAGTKTYALSFFSQDTMKINSALACPNPFTPVSQTAAITYNVSKDSEISAYIFDASGTLVWKGAASGTTGFNNNLRWDGKSADGRLLSNGVYLLRLYAKDPSGNMSACSGKIVLLK